MVDEWNNSGEVMVGKIEVFEKVLSHYCFIWGMKQGSWSRQCVTSRKVAGSILDGVTEIFY